MTDLAENSDDPIAPVDGPGGPWLSRHRYWLLAGLVLIGVVSQTRNQQWTTDMWMHAAAVREFAAHPFHPGDPVISAVHDSAWLSPYTWVVGRLAALFDGNALTALSIAAVVNVALVLLAFRSFVIELTGNRRAPFYALARRVGAVGATGVAMERRDPPRLRRLRGAVSIDVRAGRVPVRADPGQSTGAVGGAARRLVAPGRIGNRRIPGGALPSAHRSGSRRGRAGDRLVPLSTARVAHAVVVGVTGGGRFGHRGAVAFLPAVPLSPAGFYATSDELFYQSVPQRVFPVLLGLIVVYRRTRADWRDPIAWLIGSALLLYGVGYWSGIGRPIIFAVLLLQIAVGDGLGRVEAAWRVHHVTRWQQGYAVAFVVLRCLGLVFLRAGPVRMIPEELRPSGLADENELAKVSDTDTTCRSSSTAFGTGRPKRRRSTCRRLRGNW